MEQYVEDIKDIPKERLARKLNHHKLAGSTLPPELQEKLEKNPDKTLGEVLSEEEILKSLNQEQEYLEKYKDNERFQAILSQFMEDFLADIAYLKTINKLPKDFEQKIF